MNALLLTPCRGLGGAPLLRRLTQYAPYGDVSAGQSFAFICGPSYGAIG